MVVYINLESRKIFVMRWCSWWSVSTRESQQGRCVLAMSVGGVRFGKHTKRLPTAQKHDDWWGVLKSDHGRKSQEHQNLYIFEIQYKLDALLKTGDWSVMVRNKSRYIISCVLVLIGFEAQLRYCSVRSRRILKKMVGFQNRRPLQAWRGLYQISEHRNVRTPQNLETFVSHGAMLLAWDSSFLRYAMFCQG